MIALSLISSLGGRVSKYLISWNRQDPASIHKNQLPFDGRGATGEYSLLDGKLGNETVCLMLM